MKAFLLVLAFLFIPVSSYGALDNPGLSNQLLVETGGYDFTVTTLSTFDIDTYEFERDSKQLGLFFNTSATENVIEITIPGNLIGGNLSFYLNEKQVVPKILHHGTQDAFVMIEFSGKGEYRLDVMGTTYLPEFGASLYVFAAAFAAVVIFARYKTGRITLKGLP